MKTRRVFIDMDGVLADFNALKRVLEASGLWGPDDPTSVRINKLPEAFRNLHPIPGAIDAVRSLIGMGFEVWIATKPPTGVPHAYADKAQWILDHLPELKRRIIMTHDKGLLLGDYLIDDRVHKANCEGFGGELIRFGQPADDTSGWDHSFAGWPEVLEYMRKERDAWDKPLEPPEFDVDLFEARA